jgi:hypothetical protein
MDDRIIIDTDDYAVYLTEDHRYRRIIITQDWVCGDDVL